MNTKEVHNVVRSAKSKLLHHETNPSDVVIEQYINEELMRASYGSGTMEMNNNTPEYTTASYGSLKELREDYDICSLSVDEIKELLSL